MAGLVAAVGIPQEPRAPRAAATLPIRSRAAQRRQLMAMAGLGGTRFWVPAAMAAMPQLALRPRHRAVAGEAALRIRRVVTVGRLTLF